jgi:uncharacterized protein (DUF433 family)
MANISTMFKGIIHGKTIELESEPGMEEGQEVSVEIRPIATKAPQGELWVPPWWLALLDIDPAVRPGKFVIKGTHLLADALVEELEAGHTEQKLLEAHPEVTPKDVAAVREYSKVPIEMRRCFGAWADESDELDEYLEWTRQHRKVGRRGIDD